jgi:hypothetical protein
MEFDSLGNYKLRPLEMPIRTKFNLLLFHPRATLNVRFLFEDDVAMWWCSRLHHSITPFQPFICYERKMY